MHEGFPRITSFSRDRKKMGQANRAAATILPGCDSLNVGQVRWLARRAIPQRTPACWAVGKGSEATRSLNRASVCRVKAFPSDGSTAQPTLHELTVRHPSNMRIIFHIVLETPSLADSWPQPFASEHSPYGRTCSCPIQSYTDSIFFGCSFGLKSRSKKDFFSSCFLTAPGG